MAENHVIDLNLNRPKIIVFCLAAGYALARGQIKSDTVKVSCGSYPLVTGCHIAHNRGTLVFVVGHKLFKTKIMRFAFPEDG